MLLPDIELSPNFLDSLCKPNEGIEDICSVFQSFYVRSPYFAINLGEHVQNIIADYVSLAESPMISAEEWDEYFIEILQT